MTLMDQGHMVLLNHMDLESHQQPLLHQHANGISGQLGLENQDARVKQLQEIVNANVLMVLKVQVTSVMEERQQKKNRNQILVSNVPGNNGASGMIEQAAKNRKFPERELACAVMAQQILEANVREAMRNKRNCLINVLPALGVLGQPGEIEMAVSSRMLQGPGHADAAMDRKVRWKNVMADRKERANNFQMNVQKNWNQHQNPIDMVQNPTG